MEDLVARDYEVRIVKPRNPGGTDSAADLEESAEAHKEENDHCCPR